MNGSSEQTKQHELDCWTFAGWEPDREYRRRGRNNTVYFGNGEWIPAWRRRLVAPETVRMVADSGITLVVTHFYKGYGLKTDSAEWPRLRDYVRLCHEHGLKVWGYVQGQSLYKETLFAEQPEAAGWAARRYDGSVDTWAGTYHRLSPCLTAPGYRQYLLRVFEVGLTELGLDGIHLDNSYYKHCYCERCRGLFREFLNAMPDLEERTGLPNADQVDPPPLAREPGLVTDPLRILWMEFGTRNRLAFMEALYRRLKELRPDAVLHTNPAFPKRLASKLYCALDPVREARVCDVVCAETGSLPRIEDGRLQSQAEAYLMGDAAGYRVLSTAWRRGAYGHSPAETPAGIWTGLAEEFSHHAALLGNNWLLRAAGDGDRMLADLPELPSAHAEAVRFFRALHRDLRLGNRRQWAEIGILVDPDSLSQAESTDVPVFRALLAGLQLRGVPVVLVLGEQPVPAPVKVLCVCQQSCLSEDQLERIRDFAAVPGHAVWAAGESGRFDKFFVPRNASRWREWRTSPGFLADEGATLQWTVRRGKGGAYFGGEAFDLTARAVEQIDGFLESVRETLAFRADLPRHILVNTEATGDGRLLVHLRDQAAAGMPVGGVQVHLDRAPADATPARLHTPDHPAPRIIEPEPDPDGRTRYPLPAFEHYALLTIEPGHTVLQS